MLAEEALRRKGRGRGREREKGGAERTGEMRVAEIRCCRTEIK